MPLCVGWLSQRGIFLSIGCHFYVCKFAQGTLPEMEEINFPFYLVLDATCLKLVLAG